MNALVQIEPANAVDAYRVSTNAAETCKAMVVASAQEIQGRLYIKVEGWQAIAVAHGCAASARDVERVEGGVRAIGEVRRMSDGVVIAEAEGFVGEDETTWYGGMARKWKWGSERGQKVWYEEEVQKRPDYAIRAMAQTRAISRACRSAFAHVVVMMNAGLSTTPAEEVPDGGFDDNVAPASPSREQTASVLITDDQRNILMTLATSKGIDARTLCNVASVAAIKDLPASQFEEARAWIARQKPRAARPQEQKKEALLDDEIPY